MEGNQLAEIRLRTDLWTEGGVSELNLALLEGQVHSALRGMASKLQDIKRIDDYMKPYLEAYDTPLNIDWDKKGTSLVGNFKVQDLEYKIYSDIIINGFMTYKFKYKKQKFNFFSFYIYN